MANRRSARRATVGFICLLMVTSFSGFWNAATAYAENASFLSSTSVPNSNKLIQLTPPIVTSGGNSLTVKGRFVFFHPGSSVPEPIGGARVDVKDNDWDFDETVASGMTDDDGYFYFDGINNDDGWNQDGRDIYVEVFAENWAADVVDNPQWMQWPPWEDPTYHANNKDYTRENVPDHSLIDFGTMSPEHPGAYNILNTVRTGWRFLVNQTGFQAPQVKVFFRDDFTPGNSYCMPSSISERYSIPDWAWIRYLVIPLLIEDMALEPALRSLIGIHIQADDQDHWKEDVILHEYGHFVMDQYADFWPPDTILEHEYLIAYNPQHAWGEGWAHFFSAAARHLAGYPYSEYTGNPEIETNHQGDDVEGAVAGVLWDIYDAYNSSSLEANDTLELGFYPIWDILRTYNPPGAADHPWNIYDFWDGWYASWWWQWGGYRYSLWSIFALHGMNVPPDSTPPSNPADIRSSHSPYVWSGDNTVDVWWGPAADDISGAKDYLVAWDNAPATVPVLNASGTTLITDTNVTSPPLIGDNWWVHVRTRDNAENWATGATHYGPFYIEAEISISVIPTTILREIHHDEYAPTVIGSTTLPPGSVIKLKVASGLGGSSGDRVEEYEAWSELTFPNLHYVGYATVDSQGQFAAQFDAGNMAGINSVIALWYDGSGYWHRSDLFQIYVTGLNIHLEVIPDTIYPNEPARVFGSTNLPPGTKFAFRIWAPDIMFSLSPWKEVVIDKNGNFTDEYAPPLRGWSEGEWAVGYRTDAMGYWVPHAYFHVIPLPPLNLLITPSTATLRPTLGSSVNYTISIKNDGPTDTFCLSIIPPAASHLYRAGWTKLNLQYQTWVTVASGKTLKTTLNFTAEKEPILLGDNQFKVSASSTSYPRPTSTAQATLRIDFTPTLPAAPTGGLAVDVQPKTTYMLAETFGWMGNITVVNNQNFDDAITVKITNIGISPKLQADLNWFNFPGLTAGVYIPAGQSIEIPLLTGVPAGTPNGMYMFKVVATSTANSSITAENRATIQIGEVIPEFPSTLSLLFVMLISATAVSLKRKSRLDRSQTRMKTQPSTYNLEEVKQD